MLHWPHQNDRHPECKGPKLYISWWQASNVVRIKVKNVIYKRQIWKEVYPLHFPKMAGFCNNGRWAVIENVPVSLCMYLMQNPLKAQQQCVALLNHLRYAEWRGTHLCTCSMLPAIWWWDPMHALTWPPSSLPTLLPPYLNADAPSPLSPLLDPYDCTFLPAIVTTI